MRQILRKLRADLKGRRELELAIRAEDRGDMVQAERHLRHSNRLFRLLRDGGNPWRDGPISAAVKYSSGSATEA